MSAPTRRKATQTHVSQIKSGQPATLDDVVILLKTIIDLQQKPPFNAGSAAALTIATAFGLTISLALNDAFVQSFKKARDRLNGPLGAWVFALISLVVGITIIFLVYIYLEPYLAAKFE